MGQYHDKRFPGESDAYRAARDALLTEEMALRTHIEAVAEQRRQLPPGGKLKEDYVFEEGAADLSDETALKQTRFSDLFADGKDCLVIYSFMYAPGDEKACPMCTSILDSLNGTAPHANDRINLAVVARAPIRKIRAWARSRGWNNLRLLSSANNSYNADYFAEEDEKHQLPALNVFRKTADGIHHCYSTEILYAPRGQDARHVDLIWPLWNLFDLTPIGRGTDWYPRYSYERAEAPV